MATTSCSAAQVSVIDLARPADVDRLVSTERLFFDDTAIAVDGGKDGVDGQAYRLYQAAFDRTPDSGGLGYWIDRMDQGVALFDVATALLLDISQSQENRDALAEIIGKGMAYTPVV